MAALDGLWALVAGQSMWTTAVLVFLGTLAVMAIKSFFDSRSGVAHIEKPFHCGEITAGELTKYDGRGFAPICLAVRGTIYDVTAGREFYGPGVCSVDCYSAIACYRSINAVVNTNKLLTKDRPRAAQAVATRLLPAGR